ncbi:MAG: U32 family peptidase [Eubacterium sp.]|nr:U32 family peptidase [Eubacterium sp.]
MRKSPEILAPAGSIDIVYAATAMGADAVYVGAPRFGARAFAKNPSVEELAKAIADLHLRGKRLYLTTNTLLTDRELEELPEMMDPLVEAGLDAAIVQDPGVLVRLHELYPELALHASTQMALFSGEEAELLRPYGVTRFVPARELTIDEIRKAREQTDLEIEVFVHGALCVCYSGWCLMSEYIGGRSGNRGACAGPCRLPYRRGDSTSYELNARDSETLLHIPELIEAGIDSFKIEGRMKSREYASYIAYLYRHYSDVYLEEGEDHYRELVENRDSVLWQDRKKAMELYNRGGFFSSFLFAKEGEPTIETKVKGHFGLPVGTVEKVNRTGQVKETTCEIRLTEKLRPGDVLAIRDDDGETVYEFTVGGTTTSGQDTRQSSGRKNGEKSDRADTTRYTARIGFSEVKEGQSVFRTKNRSLLEEIDRHIDQALAESVVELTGRWTGRIGEPVQLEVSGELIQVTVTGDVLQEASKRPVTAEDVRERLSQLGGSGYRWKSLSVEMEEGAFLPLKAVKEMRRQAIAAFEKRSIEVYRERTSDPDQRKMIESGDRKVEDTIWISVQTPEQVEAVLTFLKNVSQRKIVLHVKLDGFSVLSGGFIHSMWEKSRKTNPNIEWAFSLPKPWRGKDRERWEPIMVDFFSCFTGSFIFLANSMASLVFRNRYLPDILTVADENLYMWNEKAKDFYRRMKVMPGPERVYGRIPVMTTNHALSEGEIVTPKGDRFLIWKPEAGEYRVIYTAEPMDKARSTNSKETLDPVVREKYAVGIRIDLTTETGEEIRASLRNRIH